MENSTARIFVVNLSYKWLDHPEIKLNTAELVRSAITNQVFAIGNGGLPNDIASDDIDLATYCAGLNPEAATVLATQEDREACWQKARRRIKSLKAIQLGDILVFNVPGHGVVSVGVVTETYKQGTPLAAPPHGEDPFTRQVSARWLVVPKVEGDSFKSFLKVGQLGIIATASVNPQPDTKGRQLLTALLVLAQ